MSRCASLAGLSILLLATVGLVNGKQALPGAPRLVRGRLLADSTGRVRAPTCGVSLGARRPPDPRDPLIWLQDCGPPPESATCFTTGLLGSRRQLPRVPRTLVCQRCESLHAVERTRARGRVARLVARGRILSYVMLLLPGCGSPGSSRRFTMALASTSLRFPLLASSFPMPPVAYWSVVGYPCRVAGGKRRKGGGCRTHGAPMFE